jgi:hypothetical protein
LVDVGFNVSTIAMPAPAAQSIEKRNANVAFSKYTMPVMSGITKNPASKISSQPRVYLIIL